MEESFSELLEMMIDIILYIGPDFVAVTQQMVKLYHSAHGLDPSRSKTEMAK